CPPGQTCIEGSSGSCECVGPPPPCDGLTEPFCGSGVCPPGMQCVSLYDPKSTRPNSSHLGISYGDVRWEPNEDCSTCPADCGPCPPQSATTTGTSCPTTTAPFPSTRPFPYATRFRSCPPGQTCIEGSSGSCECVGPPPPCDGLTEPFCGSGVCPPGMQCVSL